MFGFQQLNYSYQKNNLPGSESESIAGHPYIRLPVHNPSINAVIIVRHFCANGLLEKHEVLQQVFDMNNKYLHLIRNKKSNEDEFQFSDFFFKFKTQCKLKGHSTRILKN